MKPLLLILLFMQLVQIQIFSQEVLFPGLSGEDLISAIQSDFTPPVVPTLAQAKDLIYSEIDLNTGDSVRCVYSDHALFLQQGVDPSQWLFKNGIPDGINIEHTYPVSKGASQGTNGNSDMHHLFPTRVAVNERRASFPFGEIADQQTTSWFYKTLELPSEPLENIDLFSEFKTGFFEPREGQKGNVARAMFYFYTVYQNAAMSADPAFFDLQRLTFCAWHMSDPVDSNEQIRSLEVAQHQGNVENPFVLDCSAAIRCYCEDTDFVCDPTTSTTGFPIASKIDLWTSAEKELHYRFSAEPMGFTMHLFDILGRDVMIKEINTQFTNSEGLIQLPENLDDGVYFARVIFANGTTFSRPVYLK